METIIKKAIKGGWKTTHEYYRSLSEASALAIIDPLFWQALFPENIVINYVPLDDQTRYGDKMWFMRAIQFQEINLTHSFEKAIEWLTNLIKETNEKEN